MPAGGDESLRLPPSGELLRRRQAAAARPALATDDDFADGVNAYSGRWLGGEVLATFDRKSATLLEAQGQPHCPGKTASR